MPGLIAGPYIQHNPLFPNGPEPLMVYLKQAGSRRHKVPEEVMRASEMTRVLRELLHGKHAHTDSLACVDVPADVAGQLPEWSSHSIWQLVWHVNFWMDHELKRVAGLPARYPERASLSWPTKAPPSTDTWRRELARFGELLGRLAQHAGESAEQLARAVPATHSSELEHASSLEAVLWQTIVHNSYHIGQIVVLRKALGAWPPKSGSDTW